MKPSQSISNSNTNTKENRDVLSAKNESESMIEKQLISNTYSVHNDANCEDPSDSFSVKTDDFNITIDEVTLLGHSNVENAVEKMTKPKKDMEMEEDNGNSVQMVKNQIVKMENEGIFPEDTVSDAAKSKNVNGQLICTVYETFDKCEKDIKIEAVFFDENNGEISESEEKKVQIKTETQICVGHNVDNFENEGMYCFV